MRPTPDARPSPGFRRGERVADLLTADHVAFVASSNAAERTGDAAIALDYHVGVPAFRRSRHRIVLTQLVDLAAEMTPWMWARWAAYQCTRIDDRDTACGEAGRAALDYTLRMFHGDELDATYLTGGDPMKVASRTVGEDWIFHQVCTFELGGLAAFLESEASGRLAEQAGLARDWAGALVGGHQVVTRRPGGLVVRDLPEDREVELLDIGAGLPSGAEWLLGRLVPSGTTPALMFDTRPLPVDRPTAEEASTGDRHAAWLTALVRATGDGRLDAADTRSEDRELVSDVAGLDLLARGTAPSALATVLDQLDRGRDEICRAAYRLLRDVAAGTFGGDHEAAYVAAAVVNPHGYAEARRQLAGPAHRAVWEHWAGLVPQPARDRLLRLGEADRDDT